MTDRNGRVREFDYDNLHRQIEERWLDGPSVVETISYDHDALGQLLQADDSVSTLNFTFDGLGRLITSDNLGTSGHAPVVLSASYDAAGNRTALDAVVDDVDDFANTYVYDPLNRLTRVQQTSQTGGNAVADKRVDFAYNKLGQFTSIERFADLGGTQSVVLSTYSYDQAHRLTGLSHAQDTTTLADYDWTYDKLNRVTSFTSLADGTATYTYDDTSQITSALYDYQSNEDFGYDLAGNRTGGGYTTGTNNRLLSDGTYNYTYDDEGNRTRRDNIATGESAEYSWDHRNRLTKIVEKNDQGAVVRTIEYDYDPFDRRIQKTNSPAVGPADIEQYAYNGPHIALRFDNGTLANRYLHGPAIDQILADEQLDLNTGQTDQLLWPLADNLGTIRDLAQYDDATGITSIANHLAYDSFGQVTSETNSTIDHLFAYTGRERDEESDLYYYRARHYDPAVGRFASEDPIGFAAGDVNLSRYVGNGATNATDPSGLQEVGRPELTTIHTHPPKPKPKPTPRPEETHESIDLAAIDGMPVPPTPNQLPTSRKDLIESNPYAQDLKDLGQ